MRRTFSLILSFAIAAQMLCGCGNAPVNDDSKSENEINTIAESESPEQTEDTTSAKPENTSSLTDWEKYSGDIETFVYGLLIRQLQYIYDVFPAFTVLSNGETVTGLAYTDYQKCYTNDNETSYVFETGFLPYSGEVEIPQDEFEAGLQIRNAEYTDEKTSFILTLKSDPFIEHCVVYNKYLKYGVNESGSIFYEAEDYTRGKCDESIGSLYSYDEERYVYEAGDGDFIEITGTSLYEEIDYQALEEEINRILKNQEQNFASVDVETCAYYSKDAVMSYLLAHQEESFLGYSAAELIKEAKNLDPLECYRLTKEGFQIINLIHEEEASAATRWIVGTVCAIAIAVSMVASVPAAANPALSSYLGAQTAVAIEMFMQVAKSGKRLTDVEWKIVMIEAVAGATSGVMNPYVNTLSNKSLSICLDSLLDGFVGGVERAAAAWIDGEDSSEIIKEFGYGIAIGMFLSAGFKGAASEVEKIAKKAAPSVKKISDKILPKLKGKRIADVIKKWDKFKKAIDASLFHSEYFSRKIIKKQLKDLVENGSDKLAELSLNQVSANNLFDKEGRELTKEALQELFESAKDGELLARYIIDDEIVDVIKKNGMVGIVFDSRKYQTIIIPNGLTENRKLNFIEAAKVLLENWRSGKAKIPQSIEEAIKNSGFDLESLTPQKLVEIIQRSDWVIHENIDMISITLVPRLYHKLIPHMGGVGLVNFIKSHLGNIYFNQFISAASTAFVHAAN